MSKRDLTLVWDVVKEADNYSLYWSNTPITNWQEAIPLVENINEHSFVHSKVESTVNNFYLATGNIGNTKYPSNIVVRNKDLPECIPTSTANYNTVTNPEAVPSQNMILSFTLKEQGSSKSYPFSASVPPEYLNIYSNTYNWIGYVLTLDRQFEDGSLEYKQQFVTDILSKLRYTPYKELSGLSKQSASGQITVLNEKYLKEVPLEATVYEENPTTFIISKPSAEEQRTLLAKAIGFSNGIIDDASYQYYSEYYKLTYAVDVFNSGNDIEIYTCGKILLQPKEIDYTPTINSTTPNNVYSFIELLWGIDAEPDYYNIYHFIAPFESNSLPAPLETYYDSSRKWYQHRDANLYIDNYYMVEAVKNGKTYFSSITKANSQIKVTIDNVSINSETITINWHVNEEAKTQITAFELAYASSSDIINNNPEEIITNIAPNTYSTTLPKKYDWTTYYFKVAAKRNNEIFYSEIKVAVTDRVLHNGWLFFADSNWFDLFKVKEIASQANIDNNKKLIADIFKNFFGSQKRIGVFTFDNSFSAYSVTTLADNFIHCFTPYYEGITNKYPNTSKQNYLPILHSALDELGYTFYPVNLDTIYLYDASTISTPCIFPLLPYTDRLQSYHVASIKKIAKNNPVIFMGEWENWHTYDDYVIDKVFGYTSEELSYDVDEGFSNSAINSNNSFGSLIINSGSNKVIHDATGTFKGTLAEQYAFAKSETSGKPTMLIIPYRD